MNRDNLTDYILTKKNYQAIDKCLFSPAYTEIQCSADLEDEKDNTSKELLKNGNSVTDLEKEIQDVLDRHPRIKSTISEADKQLIEQLTATVNGDKQMFIQRLSEHISKTKTGIFPWLKERLYPNFTIITKKKGSKSQKKIQQTEMNFTNNEKQYPELNCLKQFKGRNVYKRLTENWDYTIQECGGMNDKQIEFFINLCKKESEGKAKHDYKDLLGLFTEELASRVRQELMELKNKS